jgi:NAD(P)-dependent dehydrogenase (short-subunit alcohol dehydrogenase family)
MTTLQGKTAIITGGAGGIGAATGRLFAREGAHVVLVDRDEAQLRAAVEAAESDRVSYCVADVSDEAQTRAYIDAAIERHGGLDVLFANAGIEGKVAPLTEVDSADFDRILGVNVRGVFLGIKHAMPMMAKRGGGSIIITSSVAGLVGFPGLGPYVTTKHAIIGLMRSAALEGAPMGVRVNTVHPGPIANRMMQSLETQSAPDAPQQAHAGFEALVPMGRYGTNEEIAAMTLFLASSASSYCTGNTFVADGGLVAR